MEKGLRTLAMSMLILLMAILVVAFPACAQNEKDVTLYLYGDNPTGDGGYFSTDAPTSQAGESNDYGPSGGVLLLYILGTWETEPLQKDLHINGQFSFAVWLENHEPLPALVTVSCYILIDGVETGVQLESDETMLGNSPQELAFSDHVDVSLNAGERFGIYMTIKYRGSGFTFYWASVDYASHIIVPANWVSLQIAEPTVDEVGEDATIEASVINALGTEEIVDYEVQIDGPSTASSISGPSLTQQGNAMIASWVWNYGADNAEGAIYTATVTVTDNSGNEWADTEDFRVGELVLPSPINNWEIMGFITENPSEDLTPSLMIDNNGIFWLAFASDRSGNGDIWVKSSSDGINWNNPVQVTINESGDAYPCMIQDSGGTYRLAWASDRTGTLDMQIWMSKSSDGLNWDEPYQAASLPFLNFCPSLIEDSGGTYWLTWSNFNLSTFELFIFISSSSDCISWSTPAIVPTSSIANMAPSLIQDDKGMYRIVYSSYLNDAFELCMSSSNDGNNWNTPAQITNDGVHKWFPSLIQNVQGGFDIAFNESEEVWRISSLDGISWSAKEQVTNFEGSNEADPSIVQDSDGYYWVALTSDFTGNSEIWMTKKIGFTQNTPPQMFIYDLTAEQSEDITFEYLLIDDDDDVCSIEPEYSTDGANFYPATKGAGGNGTVDLASSTSGVYHTYVWASGVDLEGIDDSTVYFRITPHDPNSAGESDTTDAFHVDNNEVPEAEISTPTGAQNGDIIIKYILRDKESDALSILAEYSKDGVSYSTATMGDGGDGKYDITSKPNGEIHSFAWNSRSDIRDAELSTVYFRITPGDDDEGSSSTTSAFTVDNKDPTIISGPFVADITDTTATIEWETDEPCNSTVRYGALTSDEFEESSSYPVTSHAITLKGLMPDTGYLYRVFSSDQCGNGPAISYEHFFTTEKPENKPPVITVTSPKQGDKVKDKIEVKGTATDPDEGDKVQYVEFRIDDGEWTQITGTALWSFEIDPKSLENGEHSIYIRAYDGELYSEEAKLTIQVNNPEDLGLWLLIVIAAIVVIGSIIKIAFIISKVKKRRVKKTTQTQYQQYVRQSPFP